jgi:TolB-like protein/Tfp pilus assembly protein PilF
MRGDSVGPDSPKPADATSSAGARLDSWKEIAAYLNRHVTTVRRWEKSEGLPVHRHLHDKLGSVYAFRAELDAWWQSRRVRLEHEPQGGGTEAPDERRASAGGGRARLVRTGKWWILVGGIALLFIAAAAYVLFPGRSTQSDRRAISSLAVLPLENLSADPAQDYLAEGVTEALIGQLAQIRALRVVSRTSSMAVKGSHKPLPEIAKALGVDAVVQGSVQRSGDRVRIDVRLIDGRSDAHLWARDYEQEVTDILKLQSEVARAVGEEIRVQITAEERARMASARAVHSAAHQEYLIGRYHLWRDNDEHLQRAIAHFERAIEFDPHFASAHASLAHAWWKRGLWGDIGLVATEAPARAAVQKALQLDDALPEAYVVQADLVRLYDRDLVRAEELVARALALQPHNVDAHYTYALVLMTIGRFDEAIGHMETAERLDPLSPAIQSDFGRVLYRARRYDDAIQHLTRALELEPAMGWLVHSRLAQVYEQMGEYDRAFVALQQAGERGRSHQTRRASVLARMGRRNEAKRLIEEVEVHAGESGLYEIAAAYTALGNNGKAFRLLFDLIDRGDPGPNFAAVDPPFDSLHADPRWPELVRRLRMPRAAHAGVR